MVLMCGSMNGLGAEKTVIRLIGDHPRRIECGAAHGH
jgi:hypothetical protein